MVRIRRNQVIATEGVLPYREKDGTVKKYLKRWVDLEKLIGTKVKLVDGHPPEGIIGTNTKILKEVEIHQCPAGKKALCIDYIEDETMPKRKGYSLGYIYEPTYTEGKFGGIIYDSIQAVKFADHIALTDEPRNPLTVVTDSVVGEIHGDVSDCNTEVIKRVIAYDSYRDFYPEEKMVKAMTDENALLKEISDLKSEIATYKATQSANDAFTEELKVLEKKNEELVRELKIKQDAIATFEKLEEDRKQLEMKKTVEFLKEKKINIDGLPDKTISFLEGIKWQIENPISEPTTSVSSTATNDVRKTKIDGVEIVDNTNNFVYDKLTDKFVRRSGK